MSPQFDSAGRKGTVKQIPRLVSHEMITFVAGTVGADSTLHCLFKGNRTVVVQSTFLSESAISPQNTTKDPSHPEYFVASSRALYQTLETIQTLLNSIEFGRANWAFVNQTADGFHISHRRKSFQHLITCPLWAPFIYDNEIEITRWNTDGHANGYWMNKPVDIWYGWDQEHMKQVNKAMHAGRILRGHDLTQEVYGHLFDGDENVIGLVIEATKGRTVQLGDRALLYEAVAKLQRLFCIFAGINSGTVLVHDGKVRFADMCCITYYHPDEREEFDDLTERYHWNDLEKLFAKLEDGLAPFPHYQLMSTRTVILTNCFSPERPLLATYFKFCFRSLMDPDQEYDSVRHTISSGAAESDVFEAMRDHEDTICKRMVACQIDSPVNHHRRYTAGTQSDSSGRSRMSSRRIRQEAASPVSMQDYYSKHPALVVRPRHSYQRSIDSDCTSESGQSRFEEVA